MLRFLGRDTLGGFFRACFSLLRFLTQLANFAIRQVLEGAGPLVAIETSLQKVLQFEQIFHLVDAQFLKFLVG